MTKAELYFVEFYWFDAITIKFKENKIFWSFLLFREKTRQTVKLTGRKEVRGKNKTIKRKKVNIKRISSTTAN